MKLAAFLVLIGLSEACLAFRCGNQLVDTGDTRYEVEAICGAPDDASTYTAYRSVANNEVVECDPVRKRSVESLADEPEEDTDPDTRSCLTLVENRLAVQVEVDVWLYDRGRNRFMQQVTFENGRVTRIDALDYGKKPRR